MTDVHTPQAETDAEDWSDVEQNADAAVSYPEFPTNPHNHRFTISMDGRGPMLVIRANTGADIQAASEELEDPAVGAALGRCWAAFKAGAALGNGMGATPVPQGAPAAPQAPQMPTPPPFGPNVSVPGAPGFVGNPGFQASPPPQGGFNGGQQGNRGPKPRPMDWPQVYKIDVPFQAKDQFKAYREQYKDHFRGKLAWAGGGAYWVHGDVAQALAQYNPVPA